MSSKNAIKQLFEELSKNIENFSEEDFLKLETGNYELAIKIVKKKGRPDKILDIQTSERKELLERLEKCHSREEGDLIVSKTLKTKKELEQFAKYLDILVLKQDKLDHIRNKIIEATVGALLRSNAILGKSIIGKSTRTPTS